VATWTVFLSVILHGVTEQPQAKAYGALVADEPVEHLVTAAPHEDPVPRSLVNRGLRSPSRHMEVPHDIE